MVTAGTHVDGVGEDDAEDDEQFEEAEEDQDVVEFEVEGEAVVVVVHGDGEFVQEGIWLEQQYHYFQDHVARLPRSYDRLLLVQDLLALLQLDLRLVTHNRHQN